MAARRELNRLCTRFLRGDSAAALLFTEHPPAPLWGVQPRPILARIGLVHNSTPCKGRYTHSICCPAHRTATQGRACSGDNETVIAATRAASAQASRHHACTCTDPRGVARPPPLHRQVPWCMRHLPRLRLRHMHVAAGEPLSTHAVTRHAVRSAHYLPKVSTGIE